MALSKAEAQKWEKIARGVSTVTPAGARAVTTQLGIGGVGTVSGVGLTPRQITPWTPGITRYATPQAGEETSEVVAAGIFPWAPEGGTMWDDILGALGGGEPGVEPGAEPGTEVGTGEIATAGLPLLAALPAVGGLAATAGAWVMGKGLLPMLVRMGLAGGAASVAWNWIANLFGLNPLEAISEAEKMKRKPKRYSIGTNPRLNTLLKVGKRVDNIFVRYDKRISKFRSRLRGYRQPRRQHVYRQDRYLSPVENSGKYSVQ